MMRQKFNVHKILVGVIGVGWFMLFAASCFPVQHQGEQFISAVTNKRFYLEGDLASFLNPSNPSFCYVVEYKDGEKYGIEYQDRSYHAVDSEYYIEDENKNYIPLTEDDDVAEMFSMSSVISNRDFSNMRFCCEGSDKIVAIESAMEILCHYEEYQDKESGDIIRLYFRKDKLYAIQAKEGAHNIFYVSVFSEEPQSYLDES